MTETRGIPGTPERARPSKDGNGPVARLTLFVRQVIAELRKVTWPTRQQLTTYWVVVLVFVLILIGIVSVMDLFWGWLVFQVLG